MKVLRVVASGVVLLAAAVMLTACSAAGQNPGRAQPSAFIDPFAYCAAVGSIDAPDARYSGPAVPDEIIAGFKKAAGLEASTEPSDMFRKATIWRCMNSKVYACNFGANLPCDSKANADKTPTPEMAAYCAANPNTDFIPMSVTGHTTIYSWRCSQDKPELVDQIATVDVRGYLSQIWYAIQPSP